MKQVCWGIFKTVNNKTPMVYCETRKVAEKMMKDKEYIHYNSKYNTAVIKKMIQESKDDDRRVTKTTRTPERI
tara:strand:- start:630 stop:848 length:219 start_codon:yes stop_codon:yes gene_type:complete